MRLDKDDVLRAAAQVAAELEDADTEDGPAALANPARWDLVDGPVLSTRNMDDDELREAVVTDLIVAEDLRRSGREIPFDARTLVRFLRQDQAERTLAALADPTVMSFLQRRDDGELRINPAHFQDACDYAGVWPEGIEPLTHETVYYAGPQPTGR